MLLLLPVKLLEQILDYVAIHDSVQISTTIILASTVPIALSSLVLTCRALYRHLLQTLYRTVAFCAEDYPHCIFNPSLVQHTTTLVVLPADPYKRRNEASAFLGDAVIKRALENFHNIQNLYLLTKFPKTIFEVANSYNLISLTCGDDALKHYIPNQWRLRSLSVQRCPYTCGLGPLLSANSDTLEHLALALVEGFRYGGFSEYEPFPLMPEVRSLNLFGWDVRLITRLAVAIRFDRLHTLQLVADTHRVSPQYRGAVGHSGNYSPEASDIPYHRACAVLELMTDALEELHLIWPQCGLMSYDGPRDHLLPQTIARKCRGLKALTCTSPLVCVRSDIALRIITFNADDLAVIAAGCEGLSDLLIGVRNDDLVQLCGCGTWFIPRSPPPASRPVGHTVTLTACSASAESARSRLGSAQSLESVAVLGAGVPDHKAIGTGFSIGGGKAGLANPRWNICHRWIKPGAPVREVCMDEMRRRMKFPLAGRGAWNDAFKPIGFSSSIWITGVLI
ncbi:hypothetical protein P167DRAFT_579191 [Morchella conica CCBAS932]|uniref:Uncharacterized protein n=1 Tax=Morchella conica CCBAS932 TaxID=1392247 RepID=A0A3N4KAK6_9PEZI|nr:hypothetical protein P167DRAFT_579191 [Morchella conica CCBAS932]